MKILGGIGRDNAYFDPLAFKPVTEARFGTAPFNVLRGPGVASWDLGVFRQFQMPRGDEPHDPHGSLQRHQPPRFSNPGGNVSNLRLNPDGTVREPERLRR